MTNEKMGTGLIKTAGFMVMATLLAKICGMARDMLIAYYYADSAAAVAYYTASRIPILLFDLVIGGVISSAFIPIFNEYLEKEGKPRAMAFANRYINLILFITIIITALGVAFSKQLIALIAPEISGEAREIAAGLSNILFPMIIFTGLAFSFVGILQSFGEFNIPSIISLVSNGVMILYFIIFKDKYGVFGLAGAMLFGWSLQAAVQVPSLVRLKFSYRPAMPFFDEGVAKAARLALPMLISTSAPPVFSMVNMRLASYIDGGRAIPALEYSNKLFIVVVGVFSFVVTNLVFPRLARAGVAGDKTRARNILSGALMAVSIVILPVMAVFIPLSGPIVRLVFERGAFSPELTKMTARALLYYSVGMLGMAFNEVLGKSFFAAQDSKTPMITALISVGLSIALSVSLAPLMGIGGLALASAASYAISAAIGYGVLSRRGGAPLSKEDLAQLLKILISALLMGAAVAAVKPFFKGKLLSVLIPSIAGAAVYAAALAAFRVKMFWWLLGNIKARKEKGA